MARVPRLTLLPIAALAIGALPAAADAADYVAEPEGGGRVALEVTRGALRSIDATLPARCENNHGGTWSDDLQLTLSGKLALQNGRFRITGQADTGVSYDVRGRRRAGGAFTGRVRLTYLDIDHVGVDDSFLCDTGTVRYRARRQ
jgi:hypothetical protein